MTSRFNPINLETYRDYVSVAEKIVEKWFKEQVFTVGHYKGIIFQQLLMLLITEQLQDTIPVELIEPVGVIDEPEPPKPDEKSSDEKAV
jgi:hypothetical protein